MADQYLNSMVWMILLVTGIFMSVLSVVIRYVVSWNHPRLIRILRFRHKHIYESLGSSSPSPVNKVLWRFVLESEYQALNDPELSGFCRWEKVAYYGLVALFLMVLVFIVLFVTWGILIEWDLRNR